MNCGPCDLGCPIGAKASTDVTYWPKALAAGARLITRARVREITLGPDGLADGVSFLNELGQIDICIHAAISSSHCAAQHGVDFAGGQPGLWLISGGNGSIKDDW